MKIKILEVFDNDKKVPTIDLVCATTTTIVIPDSRCSRISPTQAITFNPWESAYLTLSLTNWLNRQAQNIDSQY